ncbi:MAG TPA: ABC transporter permease [Actinomycetota bacterium]|nr:ABC transporter permease [Actinomycetota bacterium]
MSVLRRKLARDLARRKAQFGAVMITVFLGVALFAASYDSFRNLEASYHRTFTEFRFADLTVEGGDVARFAEQAAATAGVASTEVRTVVDVPIRIGQDGLLGRLVSLPAAGQPTVNRVKVLEGSYLDPGDADIVLLEQHLAEHFGLSPGDTVGILAAGGWREVRVRGVVSSPEYIWPARSRQEVLTSPENFGVVFGSDELAREVAPGEGLNQAVVYHAAGADGPALDADLAELARELGARSTLTREEQPSNAALREDLAGFEELSVFFPVLFLVAAAMTAYVLLTRLVQAQRPVIGGLRAEGFGRGQVLRHYLGYGLVLGLGSVPGVAAGMALAVWITGMYTRIISVPVKIVAFRPGTLVIGVVVGVVASLVAAAAPALAASRVLPAEAMRGAAPSSPAHVGWSERVVPAVRRLPARWKTVLRGPRRNLRRTLSTALGVVMALTLVLTSWGMLDTMQVLLGVQFDQVERSDAEVILAEPGRGLDRLEVVDGVAAVEPAVRLPVAVRVGDRSYPTELLALPRRTRMRGFPAAGGGMLELPEDGLLGGAALRNLVDVREGGTVQILGAGVAAKVRLAGFVDEPLGTYVYASLGELDRLLPGAAVPTSAFVRYRPGVDPDAMRRRLSALPEAAAVLDTRALERTMSQLMGLFYAFVGIMLAFGGAMAFALLFAAITVNVAERSRETAFLLAAGARGRDLARLVTFENLIVVVLGIVPGLVVGYLVSDAAMASFSSDLFRFDLHMRVTTLVASAAAVVVVTLLSQIPAFRAIRRLNIAVVVRERSL